MQLNYLRIRYRTYKYELTSLASEAIHISTSQIESAFQEQVARIEGLTTQPDRREGEVGPETTAFEEATIQLGGSDAIPANIEPERGRYAEPLRST